MRIHFTDIETDLISPGDIVWIRNTGKRSLISKKGESLNHELIKKLDMGDQLLVMEDALDNLQKEICQIYSHYSNESLMREKILYRDQLIAALREEFIENKKSQLELNLIAWKLFSDFTPEMLESMAGFDNELLQRNLTVASSYTLCAFFLGYYETSYLTRLFVSTLTNLMDLGTGIHSLTLKQKLDYFRKQDSFTAADLGNLDQLGSKELVAKTMILERYDGSGITQTNSREMSDLEIILVALNRTYGFKSHEMRTNVMRDVEISDLKCEPKILRMLQRVLYKKPKINSVAV